MRNMATGGMNNDKVTRIVSWNIAKRDDPWRELAGMAQRGEAYVALLQEAGSPPGDLIHLAPPDDDIHPPGLGRGFTAMCQHIACFRTCPPSSTLRTRAIIASSPRAT